MERSGIRCEACNNFFPGRIRLTGPDVDEQAIRAYYAKALERAATLGVKSIVFGSAGAKRVPEGFDMDRAYQQVVQVTREQIAKSGKKVLFVATKKQAKQVVAEKAASVNMPYVIERWPGGMLTNFPTIRKAVKKMTTIDKLTADGTYSNLSKREILQISRQRAKLDKTLGSIADLTRLPSALFVIDVMKENIAVREANRLGIPVFGIVDTNSDPTNIDFVIPANDDATKSVEVILDACCAAMIEGLEERKAEKIDMEAAGEAPANKGKKKSAKARLDKSDEEAINAAKAAAFLKEDEEA